jgi:hypothetical protein
LLFWTALQSARAGEAAHRRKIVDATMQDEATRSLLPSPAKFKGGPAGIRETNEDEETRSLPFEKSCKRIEILLIRFNLGW